MFDIIFISYDEERAEENWSVLQDQAPHAMRVHGVKGIANAHIEAAKKVSTSHFFTVDGDNNVEDNFNWDRIIDFQKNDKRIHVWRCRNPVNGLVYGYGGVKLWPTDHVQNIKEYSVDFTTSVATRGFKIQNTVASTTHFNTTAYSSWKSAFRECTKLSSEIIHNPDPKSKNRLLVWMSIGLDSDFGDMCLLGARMGTVFGMENRDNKHLLSEINNFDWLKENFETRYQSYNDPCLIEKLRNFDFDVVNFDKKQSEFFKQSIDNI